MKALSIRQPWAWLICGGMPIFDSIDNGDGTTRVEFSHKVYIKDIENRPWPLPKWFPLPQRIYVHAGKSRDEAALEGLMAKGFPPGVVLSLFSDYLPRGAIIGEVDIVDCVTDSDSPWFEGPYGFVLTHPCLYDKPIPCKGKLGLFEVEVEP